MQPEIVHFCHLLQRLKSPGQYSQISLPSGARKDVNLPFALLRLIIDNRPECLQCTLSVVFF